MTKRYAALICRDAVWTNALTPGFELATGLIQVFQGRRLHIFAEADEPRLTLPDMTGVLIGHVFSTCSTSSKVQSVERSTAQGWRDSQGSQMTKDVWGGYVALMEPPNTQSVQILRDPSGALPCYYAETDLGLFLASDVDTLINIGSLASEIDDTFLARHLFAFDLRSERTGLKGIGELLAGFCLKVSLDFTRTLSAIWSPWDHVTAKAPQDMTSLAEDLRATINTCLAAWAGSFRHILLGVSGGLDSSIVAAALASLPSKLSCLTLATEAADGDERHYARQLTQALNLPLYEAFHDLRDIDVTRSSSAHLPRPSLYALNQSENRIRRELADRLGIDAYFTGIGGDNVFCHIQSATPIVDQVKAKGLSFDLWRCVEDISVLTGASLTEVVGAALKRSRNKSAAYTWVGSPDFLAAGLNLESQFAPSHPWLCAPSEALPGKAVHIAMLLRLQATIDGQPFGTCPPQIHPLLSQPIVEACLAIPTWTWCQYGQNRSVARQAYAHIVPNSLIKRQSKGGPNSFAFDVIAANRNHLREHLLEGELAKFGLIDKDALSLALNERTGIKSDHHIRLLLLAEAESWSRHWCERARSSTLKSRNLPLRLPN